MFVASATSTRSFDLSLSTNPIASRRFVSDTLSVASRDVSSQTSRAIVRFAKLPVGFVHAPPLAADGGLRRDLVFDDPAGAAKLAEAVEVADERHVGVSRVLLVLGAACLLPALLRCSEERQVLYAAG